MKKDQLICELQKQQEEMRNANEKRVRALEKRIHTLEEGESIATKQLALQSEIERLKDQSVSELQTQLLLSTAALKDKNKMIDKLLKEKEGKQDLSEVDEKDKLLQDRDRYISQLHWQLLSQRNNLEAYQRGA